MEDIAPKLLKNIEDEFRRMFNNNKDIASVYAKIRDGTATYEQANTFAIEVGKILAGAYRNNLSADILPDGRMYYNIAERIIDPTMTNNYSLITEVTDQVQKALNKAAGIGIREMTPELNKNKIEGIINKVSAAENYDHVAWVLDEPVKTFSQSIVDDAIRKNAEFHSKAGMKPKIVRKVAGNCCDWCKAIAGTYTYPDNVPHDVYRRHQRCQCTVDYHPGNGKKQNVHSKQWKNELDMEEKERLKKIGEASSLFSRKEKIHAGNDKAYEDFSEITGDRYKKTDYSVKKVVVSKEYTSNGITYNVDGKHVLIDFSTKEKEIADLIVNTFGGEIQIIPRVVYPQKISTPDYIYKDHKYDLKEPTGRSKNVLYNMIAKKKSQATNFVFDISNCPLEESEILNQIEGIYKSYHTRFVDEIMIVKDNEILNVFKRK